MGINDHTVEELIKTDREAFRAQATGALKAFPPDDRDHAVNLETPHTRADDVLRAWAEQIEPIHQDLDLVRSDAAFKKNLIKNIGFSDGDADRAIDYLIESRKRSLLDEVLANLYPIHEHHIPEQQHAARALLSLPSAEINDFFSRYIDFVQSLEAAQKHDVLLCDPFGSWLDRQRAAIQINKERQRLTQDEDARLDEIERQLGALTHGGESLVGQIVAMNWNFSIILDLRAKFQKHVTSLSKDERKNPTKQLKIFERVTQSFRDSETEKLAGTLKQHSLRSLRKIHEEIYNLLLEIFDLSSAKRARLLDDIQRYTKLTQERDLILLIQRNREQFLGDN
jgi:hypothetical protein